MKTFIPYFLVTSFFAISACEKVCGRAQSRVVSRVVRERIVPVLNSVRAHLPPKCELALDRDVYAIQESNKIMDSANKWTCEFCGKSFISEYYLDRHFENRHEDKLQTENAVCLADVCDVFRCDIISGVSIPDYWDIALCLEDDMEELKSECEKLADHCIPDGLTKNETRIVKGQIMESVCSFLTCSKFWNTPYEEVENSHLALQVVLTTLTVFGILIYNFVFYNYFYSDLGEGHYEPTPKKYKIKKYPRDMPKSGPRHARAYASPELT